MTMTTLMFVLVLISYLNCLVSICGGKENSVSLFKVMETQQACDQLQGTVVLRGDHVKVSEFTDTSGALKLRCHFEVKSLRVFATTGVTIDRNIRAPGVKLFILAPTWIIIDTREINLDGKKHVAPRRTPEKNTSPQGKGVDGSVGLHGNLGGDFVGIGDEFIDGGALTISVNGGDGQDGGDGGDGADGVDGQYADKDKLSVNCFIPHCYKNEITTESNKGKLRNFACLLEYFGGTAFYPTCKFRVKGEEGRASGAGGNSGAGGKSGNPGTILLVELGVESGFKTIKRQGKSGKDGKVGKAGRPGSNGPDALYQFTSNMGVSHTTPKRSYEYNKPIQNGKDGNIISWDKAPEQTKDIDVSEVGSIVVQYKVYLLENVDDPSDPSDVRFQFFSKLDKSQVIRSMSDTLVLVDEFKILEKNFKKLNLKLDFFPLYQSLSNRTAEYAKQPNSKSRRFADHKKVLTYLYTSILGREYNLKDRSESNLVVEIGEYLDLVIESIKKYKESNKVHKIEQYKKNYQVNIKQKTQEAHELIDKNIMPEIENALKENVKNVESALSKIVELQEQGQAQYKQMEKQKKELESKLVLAYVCDSLSMIGEIVSVIPLIGDIVSMGLDIVTIGMEEGLGLNQEVNIPPPSTLPQGANAAEKQVNTFKQNAKNDLSERIDFTLSQLNEQTDWFHDLITEVQGIKQRLVHVDNIKGISQLQDELFQVIKRYKDHDLKQSNMQTALVAAKRIPVPRKPKKGGDNLLLEIIGTVTKIPRMLYEVYKKGEKRKDEIKLIYESMIKKKEYINQLKKFENSVKNEMGPALEMMSSNVLSAANALGGKSQVSLDVTKWQIQSKLKQMSSGIQQMMKGLNVSEAFENTFEKIQDALNTLISVYDRIQSFQEEKAWANYIADINSAGSRSIEISDEKLQGAIDYLDVIINCNVVIQQYQTAIDAFKQYVFPFADLFFAELIMPDSLEYGENLDELVNKAETQISHIKKKYDDYRLVARLYHSYIGTGSFNSKYRSSRPFFVWSNKIYSKMISKLFSGQKVLVLADVKKSNPFYDAVKFNEIELNFKATDKKTQLAINKILKDFKINAIHMGNSYFRSNDQYFLITTGKLDFWYSFEKDRRGKRISQAVLIKKLKKGCYMLSPYATWELQLTHNTERNRQAFDVLRKFKNLVDVELIGHGLFVFKDKLDIDIKVDKYYYPLYNYTNITKP